LKLHKRIKQIIGLCLLGCIIVWGCKNDDPSIPFELEEDTPEQNTAIHPPYIRIPIEGVISTIDPGLTVDMSSIDVTEQLFLGLTDFDPQTYQVRPELAEDWAISEDGKIYHFYLRKDVTWTDGKPVTAHDVVWAIQRNIRSDLNCPYAYMLFILENAEAINSGDEPDVTKMGVHALDDYTVEFRLKYSAAFFPAMVGLWIYRPLPRETVEKFGDAWADYLNIQTNGSYMLTDWKKGKHMILKKNPAYYDADYVSIPEIRYIIVPESSVGLVLYEHNELDLIGGEYIRIPLTEIPRIKIDPVLRKEYQNKPTFCTYYFGFNTQRPPVDNALVRKALSAAIDRQLLIEVITKGDQEPATTFTRPPIFGSVAPSDGVGIGFNPKLAKKWLAEAGFPDGKGMPPIVLMHNTSEDNAMIAQAIQTCIQYYLNVNISVKDKEWTVYVDAIEQPNTPHIFRLGWCADYPDANNWLYDVFHPKKSSNYIGWDNTEFETIVDKAQVTSDIQERIQLYRRAEQILCEEEAAIIPIYFYTAPYLVKPWIKGWYHMAMGGQHMRNWYYNDDPNPKHAPVRTVKPKVLKNTDYYVPDKTIKTNNPPASQKESPNDSNRVETKEQAEPVAEDIKKQSDEINAQTHSVENEITDQSESVSEEKEPDTINNTNNSDSLQSSQESQLREHEQNNSLDNNVLTTDSQHSNSESNDPEPENKSTAE